MGPDFITETEVTSGIESLPQDAFDHDPLAQTVFDSIEACPFGSIFALEGPWGRGKTDLLLRIAAKQRNRYKAEWADSCLIWINPWQYGTPDLLSPLVRSIVERISTKAKSDPTALFHAARSVVSAGINFGLKATAAIVPGAQLLDVLANPADKLLKGLFEAVDKQNESGESPDVDPVKNMGERFSDLVNALLESVPGSNKQLLVIIDDLDRCLPDRQVNWLEALGFLRSARPRAKFLLAIDPSIVKEGLLARYGNNSLDCDRYLDKLFYWRHSMRSLNRFDVERRIARHFQAIDGDQSDVDGIHVRDRMKQLFGTDFRQVAEYAARAFSLPHVRNPRLMNRVFTRLRMLATSRARIDSLSDGGYSAHMLFAWLIMAERWPWLRASVQDAEKPAERYKSIQMRYTEPVRGPEDAEVDSGTWSLWPQPEQVPELEAYFKSLPLAYVDTGTYFMQVDEVLRSAGL